MGAGAELGCAMKVRLDQIILQESVTLRKRGMPNPCMSFSCEEEGVGRGGCFSLEKSRVPCWRRLKTVFIQLLTAALNRFALDRPGSHRGTGGGRQKGFNKEAIL